VFVEALTKTVLESGLGRDEGGRDVGAYGGVSLPPPGPLIFACIMYQ
jgi:hypothetical protein